MPAEKAQIRLMTASPVTMRACIPAPDQVTPEQAYFKDLNFYKKTLFHTPFLLRGRAITIFEYRDAKVVFEVDDWFNTLPGAVQRYLLPLQSKYAKWYEPNIGGQTFVRFKEDYSLRGTILYGWCGHGEQVVSYCAKHQRHAFS